MESRILCWCLRDPLSHWSLLREEGSNWRSRQTGVFTWQDTGMNTVRQNTAHCSTLTRLLLPTGRSVSRVLSSRCTRCISSFSSVPVANSQLTASRRSLLEKLFPSSFLPHSQSAWKPLSLRPAATTCLCTGPTWREKAESAKFRYYYKDSCLLWHNRWVELHT